MDIFCNFKARTFSFYAVRYSIISQHGYLRGMQFEGKEGIVEDLWCM
jgi:hypothetical protein